jgi:hypothetical protein
MDGGVMERQTPKYIMDFVREIAPEGPELYMSCFNERRCIEDATKIMRSLSARVAELEVDRASLLEQSALWRRTSEANAVRVKELEAENARLREECEAALPWIVSQIEYTGCEVKDPCELIANGLRAALEVQP